MHRRARPRRRATALGVIVLIGVAIVAGCGDTAERPLVVGTEATFPPFEMKDERGNITGFDIDLVRAIARDQDFEVRFQDMTFEGLIPALNSGQIDLAISSISITEERKQSVDFTNPYINAGLVIAVQASNTDIKGIDDLEGKTIAVQLGTTGAQEAQRLLDEGKIRNVKTFPNTALAMQDLIQGSVAAVINDKPVSEVFAETQPDKIKILPQVLVSDDYGIAVKKGNTELLEVLNEGLANVIANGEMDELEVIYFSATEPQRTTGVHAFFEVLPHLFRGAGITLLVCFSAEIIGILLGMTIALSRLYGRKWLRYPAVVYVDIIRGTPLLVQILFLYFGIPALISAISDQTFAFNPIVAGILACGINSSAYLSEIYRSSIRSIDKGQTEAARSLGMNARQTFRHVIIPQALYRALPPMGNEFITLLKDTSLLSVIAVTEIVRVGQIYAARTYAIFPTYLAIAVTYFALVFIASRLIGLLERKMGVAHR